ncbi:hypothetical protein FZI85_01935 [Mycobacterium sp. CBMA293]|uniref:lipoprotein LpqH n=1 Tax=unclassified Mycolicibacterium TaxID=2636767 RepID=UPI0012DDFFA9|nr:MULTISPECIES: lipoprotein LpqH [unclassified Mycolicibacterium]MUL44822.1 hypothetical protein [Mycolicibacterium sp. CBMA 360]MUL58069.1 hypothetical protein [Mycolicibacterium sp. CBMA 335]MUL73527.1 hypothetical protein [Mycolicibacterium sp. CBMA 311]MUL95415.1 hypothetical protein [Mycolicibacterium sp. CBMA 230]MUM07501.1 hypothetical protein [Mycolicibacterium sp. CBMA 213]
MRCHTLAAVLSAVLIAGCDAGKPVVTSIVFDGDAHSISAGSVVCYQDPNGILVILVQDKQSRMRIQLTHVGRIVVQKVGLHYDDISGFVADPQEVTGTKVDDTYTVDGRMPPNPGESQWHTFKIETTCPGYEDSPPPKVQPQLGEP